MPNEILRTGLVIFWKCSSGATELHEWDLVMEFESTWIIRYQTESAKSTDSAPMEAVECESGREKNGWSAEGMPSTSSTGLALYTALLLTFYAILPRAIHASVHTNHRNVSQCVVTTCASTSFPAQQTCSGKASPLCTKRYYFYTFHSHCKWSGIESRPTPHLSISNQRDWIAYNRIP